MAEASPRAPAPWAPSLAGALAGAVLGFLVRDLAIESFASFWVVAAIPGALLPARGQRALLALTGVVAAAWLAVALTPLSGALARPLVRRDAEGPADAVLVLASRRQADGEPTAADLARMVHAAELLGEGRAERVIVTEEDPARAESARLLRTMLERLGLEGEVVGVGPVTRTRDEAVRASALCRERGWTRLVVVTSASHSRRACAAVEAAGLEVVCSPAAETEFDLETLDRPTERLVAFRTALYERAALALYARRGWLDRPPAPAP